MLDIALVGTAGMVPLPDRYLAAMLARLNGHMLLIDCGEGTQVSMRELGWGFVNLDFILFTHFHADHIAGLPGLLLSLVNYGKTQPLTIVGPKGIQSVVNSLCAIVPELSYSVVFKELSFENESAINFDLGDFHISALPLKHVLPCIGYSLDIPRVGKFNVDRAKVLGIPVELWSRLQKGESVGNYSPDMVLDPQRKGLKVSYITDTKPTDAISEFIRNSDLFICEGTYGDDTMKEKAERFYHMVFSDAARLAKVGRVKELWLTHFSQTLDDPQEYIPAIVEIFANSKAGRDHMMKTLKFVD